MQLAQALEVAQSSEGRRALAFYVSGAELGRSLVMPPGVPADRVKVLRAAFRAMIEDPELPAEIAKSRQEFQPASGEQVEKLVREVASAPREIVERVAAILRVQ
jgi:tripartite-type tricarboxylate transporter receptor subunit TctC